MNRVSSFAIGLACGVVGLYLTMHFSLVRAGDGYHIIPKIAPKIENPYTDIRKFNAENWKKRQSLAVAILKVNKGHLLQDPSLLGFRESTQQLLNQFSTLSSKASGATPIAPLPSRHSGK